MELALPIMALGGLYIISNQKKQNQPKPVEGFKNKLPNTDIPPQNYPVTNTKELTNTVQQFVDPNVATSKYFNQNVYENKEINGYHVGDTIQDGDILWLAQKLTGTPSTWQPFTNYFKGDYVAPSSPVLDAENDNLMFQCFSFLGTSGTSEPSFPTTVDAEVTDNNVLWVAKNATENPPSLEWNEYFEIDQTITLE